MEGKIYTEIRSLDGLEEAVKTGLSIVDIWAEWCGPCMALRPRLEKLVASYNGGVDMYTVNAEECDDIAEKYKIRSLPTLMAFRDGVLKGVITGAVANDRIIELLDAASKEE